MFKSLKLAHKLPLLIVCIALTLTVVLIAVSTTYFRRSVVADAENFMMSLVRDRELALHSYLKGIEAGTLTIASVPSTAKAIKDLTVTWSTRAGADKAAVGNLAMFASAASPYDVHFNRNLPPFQRIIERMGFYNVALISPDGDVVFSATQEDDYTSNLVSGPYQGSGLGEVFKKTVAGDAKQVYYSDIAAYAPSGNAPAAFAATQIIDESGRFIGVFAVQITVADITRITSNAGGERQTLDTYLIGTDLKARTRSRLEGGHAVLDALPQQPHFDTAPTAAEATARFHPAVQKPDGRTVAAVTAPVVFNDINWTIVAEMDHSELLAPAVQQRQIMLLVSLSCALLVSLLGWLFARSITKPINRICDNMEAVAGGNLDTEVEAAQRRDEIGKIGKTLLSMQDDLNWPAPPRRARRDAAPAAAGGRQPQQRPDVPGGGRLLAAHRHPFPPEYEQLRQNFNSTVSNLNATVQQVIAASGSIRSGAAEISQASTTCHTAPKARPPPSGRPPPRWAS